MNDDALSWGIVLLQLSCVRCVILLKFVCVRCVVLLQLSCVGCVVLLQLSCVGCVILLKFLCVRCVVLLQFFVNKFDFYLKSEGRCNRCQMICINQKTCMKSKEPLRTLATMPGRKVRMLNIE